MEYDFTNKQFGKLTAIEKVQYGKKKKWKCICECGTERFVTTDELTSGKAIMCSVCSRERASLKRRKNMVGNKYGELTVLEVMYKKQGNRNIPKCKCACSCGNIIEDVDGYNLRKENVLHHCGCKKKEIVYKAVGTEVDGMKFGRLTVIESLLGESPIKLRCKCDCGNEYIGVKRDITSGHTRSCGCLLPDKMAEISTVDYTKVKNDYGVEFIEQAYKVNNQWRWKCKCPLCENYFYVLPAKVINGSTTSCGCLKQSSGEKMIKNFLEENNIDYVPQYSFDDCVYENKLKFDFAITKNNSVLCLIEYNGKQHYEPIDFFGGEKNFKKQQERDKIKINYCKNNNIPLHIIPYTYTNEEVINKLSQIIAP